MIKSDIPGEESWPTQPASTISLVPEKLSVEDAWGKDDKERAVVRGANQSRAFGRYFHAAESAGDAGFSEQCGRRELGERGV